jgi:sugar-specific transcriptional regulator TrmB
MELNNQLKTLGLKNKEIKIFLVCLEFGPISISDISRKSKIKRSSIYHLLEPLLENKLIIKIPKGKRTFYISEKPQKILKILEEKRASFTEILPELDSLYRKKAHQPKINYYEGIDGIVKAYNEIFSTSKNIYSIASMDELFSLIPIKTINHKFFKTLKQHGGKIYDLVKPSPVSKKYAKEEYRKGMGPIKFLPDNFQIDTDFMITGNKVAMFSFKTLITVIIEDQDIANSHKQYFKYIWSTIK